MAIPLSTLARLEEFPVTQVEMSGNQWVTQYRGKILPLIRLSVVLEERRNRLRALQAPPAQDSGAIQVLVLNHEGKSVWSGGGKDSGHCRRFVRMCGRRRTGPPCCIPW